MKHNISFINLKKKPSYFNIVNEAFNKLITPKYGSQNKALNKIKNGLDRECEIMLVNGKPKGIIVYKTSLQNVLKFHDAFEIKTGLLLDRITDKGLGDFLFQRFEHHAKKLHAQCMFFTISKELVTLLERVKLRGWNIIGENATSDNSLDVFIMYKKIT